MRADDVVDNLAATLSEGHRTTADALRDAGLSRVVDDILTLDGYQLHDLSAEALVREVFRRAEVAEPGQGARVMAHLYGHAEASFGSVSDDPAFQELRSLRRDLAADVLAPDSFRFAAATHARGASVATSPALENAIRQLAYVYAEPNLPQLRRLAEVHFGNPRFDFDRAVAESTSTREAVTRMFRTGTPPPAPEVAAEAIMRATLDSSGALRDDARFLQTLAEMRAELGLDRLEEPQRAYVANEDRVASRLAQLDQDGATGLPGKIGRPDGGDVLRVLDAVPGEPSSSTARTRSAQWYSNYVSTSFEPRATTTGGSSGTGVGGGGGGSRGGRAPFGSERAYHTTAPPSSYTTRFGNASRVPRTYRVSIRSARAARGIAVGAAVSSSIDTATAAAWVPNREDGRFGKLVVQLGPDETGRPVLAASRMLFADSFYSATSVLWGGHYGVTAFTEGEILVLQSMDPFDVVDPEASEAFDAAAEDLMRRARRLSDDDAAGQLELLSEMQDLQIDLQRMPRRVVLHPSIFGRELAWSAVRVDFWFNDPRGLSAEAALTNGGRGLPAEYSELDLSEANTWQFFERDATVRLNTDSSGIARLSVRSTGPVEGVPSDRSHFGVSMFEVVGEGEARRISGLERGLQGMLDWLAVNHHDFIRLNDFSESFSLLRWLRAEGVAPLLIDMDGEGPEIATPDSIVIGEGPRIGT